MAGEDLKVVTDQDRIGEAKSLNALGNLLYLRTRVAKDPKKNNFSARQRRAGARVPVR